MSRCIAPRDTFAILSPSDRGWGSGDMRRKNVRNKLIAAALAASCLAGPVLARESAWMGLGVRPINATTTTQTIEVADTNVPRELQFCSDGSPVQILTVDLRYRNGDTQTVQVRERVRAGDCSREIGLRNRTAELASVTFTTNPAILAAGATAQVRVLVR